MGVNSIEKFSISEGFEGFRDRGQDILHHGTGNPLYNTRMERIYGFVIPLPYWTFLKVQSYVCFRGTAALKKKKYAKFCKTVFDNSITLQNLMYSELCI